MNYLKVLLFCLVSLSLSAQYDGKDPEIASRFRPGFMWFNTGWGPAKVGKPRKYDRLMVDLAYNDWINDSALFLVKPTSIGFNVHAMWDIPLNKGNGAALGIGFSYRHQHMRYDGLMLRDSANQSTTWQLTDNSQNAGFDKSVFGSHAIAVPVELRFRMKKWRHAKLHIGGYIGYRAQIYTKVWTNGQETVTRDRHFYDNNTLFYGVHARLGIRNWALFADYCFAEQFKSSQSTNLRPVALGITVSLF